MGDADRERARLLTLTYSKRPFFFGFHDLEWKFMYQKHGVRIYNGCDVATPGYRSFALFKGEIEIEKPPAAVFDCVVDIGQRRKTWDRLSTDNEIVEELARDSHHVVCLWKFQSLSRYFSIANRYMFVVRDAGVHPIIAGGYFVHLFSDNTFLFNNVSHSASGDVSLGWRLTPMNNGRHTLVTHVAQINPKTKLSVLERPLVALAKKIVPFSMIEEKLTLLKATVESSSQVYSFYASPSLVVMDQAWLTRVVAIRDDMIEHYCHRHAHQWSNVVSARGITLDQFMGDILSHPLYHHDLCLRVTFTTSCLAQFSRCMADADKRVVWEPCATSGQVCSELDWRGTCLEITGGGRGKGRDCAPFKYYIYHVSDIAQHSLNVYEEHSNSNVIIAILDRGDETIDTPRNLQLFLLTNSVTMQERTLPSSATTLRPIEHTFFESASEFRNVLELESWVNDPSKLRQLRVGDEEDRREIGKRKASEGGDSAILSPVLTHTLSPIRTPALSPSPGGLPATATRSRIPPLFALPSLSFLFPQRPLPTPSLHLFPFAPPIRLLTEFSIDLIPFLLWEHIFSYLPTTTVLQLACVCKRWYAVIDNSVSIWKTLYSEQHKRATARNQDWNRYSEYADMRPSQPNIWNQSTNPEVMSHKAKSCNVRWKRIYYERIISDACWYIGASAYTSVDVPSKHVTSMKFCSDINTVLLGDTAGDLHACSLATQNELFSIPSPAVLNGSAPVLQVVVNENREEMTAVYGSGAVYKYDFKTQRINSVLNFEPIHGCSLYNNTLATFQQNILKIWDLQTRGDIFRWDCPRGRIYKVSLGDTMCLVASENGEEARHTAFNVIDMVALSWVMTFNGHNDTITEIKVLGKNLMLSGARDGVVKIWDMRVGRKCVKAFKHPPGTIVECLDASPTRLVTCSSDCCVTYWDPSYSGTPISDFRVPLNHPLPPCIPVQLQIGENDSQIATAWGDGTVSLWNINP